MGPREASQHSTSEIPVSRTPTGTSSRAGQGILERLRRSVSGSTALAVGAIVVVMAASGATPAPSAPASPGAAAEPRVVCAVRDGVRECRVVESAPTVIAGRVGHDPTMGELEALAMLDSGGLPGTDGREAAAATKGIACVGDGTGGNRVQAIYAVPAGRKDRYTKVAPSIRHWAADIDIVFRKSAAVTGGTRRVRWVTAAGCVLSVMRVKVSANAIDLGVLAEELAAKGFNQVDRKYLVWLDETDPYGMMCGWGESPQDDDPGPANGANGAPFAFRGETRSGLTMSVGSYAEIYADCWGQSASMGSTEAHELAHMLGAVQSGSPNSDGGGHVTDGYDLMTTDGQLGGTGRARCKKAGWVLLDCRNDDYFSTSPKAGSYLATHWNVADSSFLTGTDAGAPVVSPPAADPGWARDDGSVTTTVTWTAIDDRAVLADALEVSTDGGPYVAVAIPMRGDDYRADHTAAEVNQDVPLLPGHTYTVRVRAMDTAGTWSTWAESSPFIVDGAS